VSSRITDLFGIELPIVQGPMAGCDTPALAAAVGNAGGLGSIACAMLSPAQIRDAVAAFRAATKAPLNLNFFCHAPPVADAAQQAAWRAALAQPAAQRLLAGASLRAAQALEDRSRKVQRARLAQLAHNEERELNFSRWGS